MQPRHPIRHLLAGRRSRRCFTLVELIATVGLLVLLGGMLIRFYANMQRAYNESLRLAALGQEARAVFTLVTRDLRLSATRENDIPGQSILIHQPDDDELWLVTSNESGSGAGTSLLEVGYRLEGTVLERAEVDDSDSDWNPYGDRDNADDQAGYQPVSDRVLKFQFVCYDERLASYVPDQTSKSPAMVGVEITLLDPKSFKNWQRLEEPQKTIFAQQRSRTFRKTIQIPAAQFAAE